MKDPDPLVLAAGCDAPAAARRIGPGEGAAVGEPLRGLDGGGRETLEDAYRRLRPWLVRLAYLMTSSPAAAEDVVQDAVVATSRRWSTIDDPDPYLRRAVVNRARSAHRTTGRERAKVDRLGGLAAPVALEPSIDETWAVLRRLPDRQRQALVLRFYEDLPDAEIADLLGCRPATVRSTGGAEDTAPRPPADTSGPPTGPVDDGAGATTTAVPPPGGRQTSGVEDWSRLCGARPGDPAMPREEAGERTTGVVALTGADGGPGRPVGGDPRPPRRRGPVRRHRRPPRARRPVVTRRFRARDGRARNRVGDGGRGAYRARP